MDIDKIRSDFPILKREIYGKPLIYLDNAATSQKPRAVIEAIKEYYEQHNANTHRGVHKLSEEATELYEEARKKIASFVNAGGNSQIIFTKNATEGINLVAYSWGRANIKAGDEILLTEMEHHSNIVPWQILAKETGAKLKFIPLDENSELRIRNGELKKHLSSKTKIVALTHVSNVLGTINPVKIIIEEIRKFNPDIKILVDGAQAVPHVPVSIQNIDSDFYVFTGHKMLGPTGVGVLYAKKELLNEMEPFITGGNMILEVKKEASSWNYVPWKFEAGTQNVSGAVGLAAAASYLMNFGMKNVLEHERNLTSYAIDKLSKINHLKIYGPNNLEKRIGVISFNITNQTGKLLHPHDVASILDGEGIAIRSGHHCAQPLMEVLGVEGICRISFSVFNDRVEIDKLVLAIEKAKKILR